MEKKSRSQRQKMVFDGMLTPMKDFYSFAEDCYEELGRGRRRERVFKSLLPERYRKDRDGKDLLSTLAERLERESRFLLSWCPGEQWNEEWERRFSKEMWETTLELWCREDSFPTVYDRQLPCGRRDIVLYVMLVCGFTVEESGELLGELSRRKDRDYIRPLYRLDFKEGFFLWLMRWNEKHPKDQVSFERACRLYEEYGAALLAWLVEVMEALDERILELLSEEKDPELLDFRESYKSLWEKLSGGNGQRINLFDEGTAEHVKRLLAVVTCAKRYVSYEKETGWPGDGKKKETDWRLQRFRKRNEQTRMNRGTRYVGERMDRLAEADDFQEAFSSMRRMLWEELGEAHWRTYSTLIWLYGRSGGGNWTNRFLLPFVKPSVKTRVGRRYGSVDIFNGDGRRQSFSLSGKSVSRLVDSRAANGKMISNLFNPVFRNENLVSSVLSQDSSAVFSDLKNNYQNWQKGRNGPYKYYKRKTVLKFLLAVGVEEPGRLNSLMEMAGSRELDYLDEKEGLVYLTASWRARLKGRYENLMSIENSRDMGAFDESLTEQEAKLVCQLPPGLGVKLLGLEPEDPENPRRIRKLLEEEEGIIQDSIFPELEAWFETSLIYHLKWMELLFLCFDADTGTPQRTLDKLFYGPCTEKFAVPAPEGRIQWAAFYKALWSLISSGEEWIAEPQRLIFEIWKNTMESGRTFAVEESGEENFVDRHRAWAECRIREAIQNENSRRPGQRPGRERKSREGEAAGAINPEKMERLNQAARQAVFLCQNPCTWEAEAALELWFYGLALWRALGLCCDTKEYRESEELLRERACFWYCGQQLKSFSLKGYRKLYGCDTYRADRQKEEKGGIISRDPRERELSEAALFAGEEDGQLTANAFFMWEKLFQDVIRLQDGMRQLAKGNRKLWGLLEESFRAFCEALKGPVREQWERAIEEQKQHNPETKQVRGIEKYYWEIYGNERTKVLEKGL